MKIALRTGGLALALIAGAALIAAPDTAHAIQKNGYFGGTWAPIGPSNNRFVQRYHRHHGPGVYAYSGPRAYYGPRYGYAGPRHGYYGPPSVSLGLGLGF